MNAGPCSVYLVRHGEVLNPEHVVYADLPGFPLSPTGRHQVEQSAERLPLHATIVTSPLERAVETATIIADRRHGLIVVDESVTEWGLGERWAGHTWESLDDVFPGELTAYLDHPEHLPFVSESLAELAARLERAVRLHQSAADGPLIVVSHQDPIQAARLSLTGRPGSGLHRDKPKHASVIELEPRPIGFWVECSMWAPDQDPVGRQPIAS